MNLKDEATKREDRMSFLSDQQPGSPFSDYGEVCKEPSLSPAVPAETWDWQHTPSMDISTPRSLMVGALATTGLTDEDKLCFFDQPGRGNGELKVPSKVGVIPGSPSLENASLGSAAESPVSPLSSSLSPSLTSPGRIPSVPACGSTNRASLEQPHSMGAAVIDESVANVAYPSEAWSKSTFGECSPVVAMPQISLSYGGTEVNSEDYVEKLDEEVAGREAVKFPVGFPKVQSDSEEEESDSELRFMVHAQQERTAMSCAMSECSNLTVPTTLEHPDWFPGEKDTGPNHPFSSFSGSGYSPDSIKHFPTVAENLPPTPPSCLSSGTSKIDLWQDLPESRSCISPFSLLNDSQAAFPPSPMSDPAEALKAEKELSGIVHLEPPGPKCASDFDISSPTSAGSDTEEKNYICSEFSAFHHADAQRYTGCLGVALNREGVTKSRVSSESDDEITTSSSNYKGLGSCSNSFVTMDGRWSLIF